MQEHLNTGPFYKGNKVHGLILQSWEFVFSIFGVFYKLIKLIAPKISDVVFHLYLLVKKDISLVES